MDSSEEEISPYLLCRNDSIFFTQNYSDFIFFCNTSLTYTEYKENYSENEELARIVSIVVPVLFGIIFIVGLCGNSLVLLVVALNKHMRNVPNLLIANLAVADLVFIVVCVPFTAVDYVLSYWPFGNLWCRMVQYIIVVTAYESVISIIMMSIARYLAVVHPFKSVSIRTKHNTKKLILISWIIVIICCIPLLFAHGLEISRYYYEVHKKCTFMKDFNHVLFRLIFMLTAFIIPLLILCLLYLGMFLRIRRGDPELQDSPDALRKQKSATCMVIAVVVVFFTCMLPINVILVLKSLDYYQINDITVGIQITAHVLCYTNSCVNPILYAFLSKNFRKSFRNAIVCKLNAS